MRGVSVSRLRAWLPTFSGAAAIAALLVGVGVLFGWYLDISLLKTLLPGLPRMPANSALALALLGISLLLLRDKRAGPVRRCGGRLLAALVSLFGFLILSEYLFGWDLGIDQLLVREIGVTYSDTGLPPGRPSLDSVFSLIFLGLALFLLDRRAWRGYYPAELLFILGAILPLVTLIEYANVARVFYGMSVEMLHSRMSLHSSLTFLLLSAGGLAARPERGLSKLFTGEGPGSTMTRYLFLAVILLPLVVAFLLILGDLAGIHLSRLALLLVTLCIALVAITLLWSVARLLNREYEERRHAQEALHQSETRLLQLIESAPDGIFIADREGRYLAVNPAGCQILGYTREEIVGKTIMDFLPPEEIPRFLAHRERLLQGERTVHEWRMRHKNGEFISVEVSDSVLPDGNLQGLVRDISERRALEEKRRRLYQEEQRLRARLEVLDNATRRISEATLSLDGGGVGDVLKAVAREAQAATGAKYVALGLGSDPEKPFAPWVFLGEDIKGEQLLTQHPRPVGILGKVAREGETIRLRDVRQHPAFRGLPLHHMEVTSFLGVPVRYRGKSVGNLYLTGKKGGEEFSEDDQKILEMLADRAGVALEIARLYQAESSERAWLKQVIEQMPEGVILVDEGRQMVIYNRAALALSKEEGTQTNSMEGPFFDVRTPAGEPVPVEESPLGRALRKGESVTGMELQICTREGKLVPVLVSATPIRSKAEGGRAAVVTFQDISQIKELERQREEWISVVAHDLRQPLSAILLSAQILRHRAEKLSPSQRRAVENILASTKQQQKMIEDLLDVSRIQTRQVRLERQEVELGGLLREVLERAGGLIGEKRVRLSVEGEPIRALVDPGRFEQIMGNLLSNAAKYGFPETDIEVRLVRREGEAEVSVTNQGEGLSPEEQKRLFVRFYRTSSARADKQVKGLGLGLYICKGLVEAHGGRLWVESTPGQTTTFSFTLPLS